MLECGCSNKKVIIRAKFLDLFGLQHKSTKSDTCPSPAAATCFAAGQCTARESLDDHDLEPGFAEWCDIFDDPVVATELLDRLRSGFKGIPGSR